MKAALFILLIFIGSNVLAQKYDIVVGNEQDATYKTIQEAINSVADSNQIQITIFVRKGIYKEKIVVPKSKTNIKLVGESTNETILTYDDYAQKLNADGRTIGTSGSASIYVYADNFTAENITFENSSGPVGQAVAARVTGDKCYFKNCRFLGFQDTLYTHGEGRQIYYKCYIEGTTDFIFGSATAYFLECDIFCKKGGSFITAASTPEISKYGYVFKNCHITSELGASYYLGRPWRPYAKVVFIQSFLDDFIKPAGWDFWGNESNKSTAFYAEYKNKGLGFKPNERVSWSYHLTKEQAKTYTLKNIMQGWNPLK